MARASDQNQYFDKLRSDGCWTWISLCWVWIVLNHMMAALMLCHWFNLVFSLMAMSALSSKCFEMDSRWIWAGLISLHSTIPGKPALWFFTVMKHSSSVGISILLVRSYLRDGSRMSSFFDVALKPKVCLIRFEGCLMWISFHRRWDKTGGVFHLLSTSCTLSHWGWGCSSWSSWGASCSGSWWCRGERAQFREEPRFVCGARIQSQCSMYSGTELVYSFKGTLNRYNLLKRMKSQKNCFSRKCDHQRFLSICIFAIFCRSQSIFPHI